MTPRPTRWEGPWEPLLTFCPGGPTVRTHSSLTVCVYFPLTVVRFQCQVPACGGLWVFSVRLCTLPLPPQFTCWHPDPQRDGVRRWRRRQVTRS